MGRKGDWERVQKLIPEVVRLIDMEQINQKEIYTFLGISETTYYKFKKKYKEFAEAIDGALHKTRNLVEKSLIKRAIGGEYYEETIEEFYELQIVNGKKQFVPTGRKIKKVKKVDLGSVPAMLAVLSRLGWTNFQAPVKEIDLDEQARLMMLNEIDGIDDDF